MNMDKEALKKIESLRRERDYYKTLSDLLQERVEDTEEALTAAKGQLQNLLVDRRYEVA